MRMRGTHQRGFSLLEVLVAFAIMALALGALYQGAAGSVQAVGEAERMTYATLMAQSLLARQESVPHAGWREEGRTEDGFRWVLLSEPYTTVPLPGGPLAFHQVMVEVGWPADSMRRSVRLVTLLPEGSGS